MSGKLSEIYKEVEEKGSAFQGKSELLKHLNREEITKSQAIKAKCYDCMGYYGDGKQDCKVERCPLYPWVPYKEGGVRKSRILSEEQKEAMGTRLKNARIRSVDAEIKDESDEYGKLVRC